MRAQLFYLITSAILGGLAVVCGAFGAHGLKARVDAELLAVFEVGVRYHMYHAIAMLAVAAAFTKLWSSAWTPAACTAWLVGVIIFSGSLYLLTLTGLRWLGAITPIGGVALILGWVFVAIAAWQTRAGQS